MKVKSESEVAQLCLTLSDPMDYSLPGSSVHEIHVQFFEPHGLQPTGLLHLQARVLEWGAIAIVACKMLV